jgi:hypothetical protein
LATPIGKFNLSLIPEIPQDAVLNSFYIKPYVNSTQRDEIYLTINGQETLYRFIDSHNYIKILQDEFEDDLYSLSSANISKNEYVNAFTYNRAFNKLLSDHLSIINNLRGKFISEEEMLDKSGFTYISTHDIIKQSGLDDIIGDIKTNINIGTNEFVLAETVNRCFYNICKLQDVILKLVEFDEVKAAKNTLVEFNCTGVTKKNKLNPVIEKPVIIDRDPLGCVLGWPIYFKVDTSKEFSIPVTEQHSITNHNYDNETLHQEQVMQSIIATANPIISSDADDDIYFTTPLTSTADKHILEITKTLPNDIKFNSYEITTSESNTDTKTIEIVLLYIVESSFKNISVNTLDYISTLISSWTQNLFNRIPSDNILSRNIDSSHPELPSDKKYITIDWRGAAGSKTFAVYTLNCAKAKLLNTTPYIPPVITTPVAPPTPVVTTPLIYGCTNPAADNYNPDADVDNGTCTYPFNPDTVDLPTGCALYRVMGYDGTAIERDYGEYLIICMDYCSSIGPAGKAWSYFSVTSADPSKQCKYKNQAFTHLLHNKKPGKGQNNIYLTTSPGRAINRVIRGGGIALNNPYPQPGTKYKATPTQSWSWNESTGQGTYADGVVAYTGFNLISPVASPGSWTRDDVSRQTGTNSVNRDRRYNERWVYMRGAHITNEIWSACS